MQDVRDGVVPHPDEYPNRARAVKIVCRRCFEENSQPPSEASMNHLQIAILQLIEASEGQLSWYQLDRALTQRPGGFDPSIVSIGLMPALRELERQGLITLGEGPNPAHPHYSTTANGRKQLETEKAG